jgi:hypothetical protein
MSRNHTKVWSKPCCNACVKAGKSNKEAAHQYETAGKITCPMIRGRGCTYCKESDHINRECPKLAAKKEREQSELNFAKFSSSFRTMDEKAAASRRWVDAKERESITLKTKNTFAALDEESSEEESVENKDEEWGTNTEKRRPREDEGVFEEEWLRDSPPAPAQERIQRASAPMLPGVTQLFFTPLSLQTNPGTKRLRLYYKRVQRRMVALMPHSG